MALLMSSLATKVGIKAEYAGPPNDCAIPTVKDRHPNVPDLNHFEEHQHRESEGTRHLDHLRGN